MPITTRNLERGLELEPLVKEIDQDRINLFEVSGSTSGEAHADYHTDTKVAPKTLGGFRAPIASGRMTVAWGVEAMAKWFGHDVAGHSARVDLRFTIPVIDGDTISVKGTITHFRESEKGTSVNLEMWVDNQKNQKVAVGTASVRIP
jgi:acyl dehydratase